MRAASVAQTANTGMWSCAPQRGQSAEVKECSADELELRLAAAGTRTGKASEDTRRRADDRVCVPWLLSVADMADKTAETAMQPLQDVFMLERETELNMGTLKNIIATGHSECWQPPEAGRRRMPESGLCVQDARGWMPGAVSSRPSCVARRVLAAARRTRYAASAAFSRP